MAIKEITPYIVPGGASISLLCKQSLCNEIDDKKKIVKLIMHLILLQSLFLIQEQYCVAFPEGV